MMGVTSQRSKGGLAGVGALATPLAALVLPPAWFKKDRILEVQDGDERQQVRLLKVLMRGANFDQCSFEAVEQEVSPA